MVRKELKGTRWFVEEPELSDFEKELWNLIDSANKIIGLAEQINLKLDKNKVGEQSYELNRLKTANADIKNRVEFLKSVVSDWREE